MEKGENGFKLFEFNYDFVIVSVLESTAEASLEKTFRVVIRQIIINYINKAQSSNSTKYSGIITIDGLTSENVINFEMIASETILISLSNEVRIYSINYKTLSTKLKFTFDYVLDFQQNKVKICPISTTYGDLNLFIQSSCIGDANIYINRISYVQSPVTSAPYYQIQFVNKITNPSALENNLHVCHVLKELLFFDLTHSRIESRKVYENSQATITYSLDELGFDKISSVKCFKLSVVVMQDQVDSHQKTSIKIAVIKPTTAASKRIRYYTTLKDIIRKNIFVYENDLDRTLMITLINSDNTVYQTIKVYLDHPWSLIQ